MGRKMWRRCPCRVHIIHSWASLAQVSADWQTHRRSSRSILERWRSPNPRTAHTSAARSSALQCTKPRVTHKNTYVKELCPTIFFSVCSWLIIEYTPWVRNKKAQLSLTNPRDVKACQKLFRFDVLTTLSLTILAYLHSFSRCCVRNLRNPEKFNENSNL